MRKILAFIIFSFSFYFTNIFASDWSYDIDDESFSDSYEYSEEEYNDYMQEYYYDLEEEIINNISHKNKQNYSSQRRSNSFFIQIICNSEQKNIENINKQVKKNHIKQRGGNFLRQEKIRDYQKYGFDSFKLIKVNDKNTMKQKEVPIMLPAEIDMISVFFICGNYWR